VIIIGVHEMRCMACGEEMNLMSVGQNDTMAARGYEQHTFSCSKCREINQRLVFMKHGRECDINPASAHAAPSTVPALIVHAEHADPSDDLSRLLAKIREDRWVSGIAVAERH